MSTTNILDLNNRIDALASKPDKTATASGETLTLIPTSEGRALLHTAYGMSTQNGTPTPSSPVDIESAKADFRSVGKNLIVYPYRDATKTVNGVTFTLNSDGTVTALTDENGATGTANFAFCWRSDNRWKPLKGNYMFTGCPQGGSESTYYIEVNTTINGSVYSYGKDYGNGLAISKKSSETSMGAGITIKQGTVLSTPIVFKPMLRLADVTGSTYEPYTKHDTTTDLTLRAIEVSSTDDYNLERDGKYYIADTLDYSEDNGFVVTRRIGHIASYDSESIITKWMSSKDAYASGTYPSAGAVVDYILTTETTETITTTQALALLELKTYDESTTISSQAEPSCTIAVEYAQERLGALALTAYNTAKGNDLRITALEG